MTKSKPEKPLSFTSNGEQLLGILHDTDEPAAVGIIILVGGPQYRVGSHRMFVQIARRMAACGYPTLRFDFRGMGDSSGQFPGFERLDEDIAAAIKVLCTNRPEIGKVVLLGLCDGATGAALYAPIDPIVKGLVLLNPWVHTESGQAKAYLWYYYPRRLLQKDFWRSLISGKVRIIASIRDFSAKFLQSLSHKQVSKGAVCTSFVGRFGLALSKFRGDVLIVNCENDLTAAEFQALLHSDGLWTGIRNRSVLSHIKGADHTLSDPKDLELFCDRVLAWLGK